MVIVRRSTKEAIEFLKFMRGIFLNDTKFYKYRIIISMQRYERENASDEDSEEIDDKIAGATLVKELRKLGYKHEVCIFTEHPDEAIKACDNLEDNIRVTNDVIECLEFANVINDSGKFNIGSMCGIGSKIRSMLNM